MGSPWLLVLAAIFGTKITTDIVVEICRNKIWDLK